MKRPLLLALSGALTAYYLAPFLGMQLASLGVYRRGSGLEPDVALTFDDGPDPQVTPQIMDALEAHGVRGTFFVLGSQVEQHPELTRQMLERGHELGLHGHVHRAAWLRGPLGTLADMRRGLETLERVTGQRPRFFRPAHGVYTAATWWGLRLTGLLAAGWTVEAHDWHADFGPDQVLERVLNALEPGGVVVMHDAALGAKNCVQVVPRLLEAMRERGYVARTLGALPGLRMGSLREVLQRVSVAQDRAWDRKNHIDRLTTHSSGLLRMGMGQFPGAAASSLPAGTPMGELHIHSPRMVGYMGKPMSTLRHFRFSLAEVASRLEHDPRYAGAQGVYAVGFYAKVMKGLGFQIGEAPQDLAHRLGGLANNALRWLYSDRPNRSVLEPELSWMTREALLEKYGSRSRRGGQR